MLCCGSVPIASYLHSLVIAQMYVPIVPVKGIPIVPSHCAVFCSVTLVLTPGVSFIYPIYLPSGSYQLHCSAPVLQFLVFCVVAPPAEMFCSHSSVPSVLLLTCMLCESYCVLLLVFHIILNLYYAYIIIVPYSLYIYL